MKIYDELGNISYSGTLEENKAQAKFQISEDAIVTGRTNTFMTSLGFAIDNRWIEKNDVDNGQCALDVWFEGQPFAYFRDTNDISHEVTKEQLTMLLKEAQADRMRKFSLKWKREYLVDNAASVEQVWYYVESDDATIDSFFNP